MNKICTSIEQSQKLLELGIDVNTADMYYHYDEDFSEFDLPQIIDDGEGSFNKHHCLFPDDIPCWSLAALLDVLQKTAYSIDEDANVMLDSYKTVEWNLGIDNSDLELITESSPVDACYEMIEKLKENNLL